MGVRFMYKVFRYICEIIISFALIFIGYFVWDKKELMRYKTDYAINPKEFQKNIFDNFEENCVCTFDW